MTACDKLQLQISSEICAVGAARTLMVCVTKTALVILMLRANVVVPVADTSMLRILALPAVANALTCLQNVSWSAERCVFLRDSDSVF